MLTVQYAQQYEADGFTFLAVTPGVSSNTLITFEGEISLLTIYSGYAPTWAALEQIYP